MDIEHSFDRKGFFFAGRLFAILFFVGLVGQHGFEYVRSNFFPSTAAASLAMEGEPVYPGTTTPRVISSLAIAQAVPQEGKFIAADLVNMQVLLYQDGIRIAEYPILTKGRPGSPYETPGGFYSILFKTPNHFNKTAKVYMPFSMQFYGNYFIHGWPYYEGGIPVESTFSGGCIRLSTEDAGQVFAFAEQGTGMFVYDPGAAVKRTSLTLAEVGPPAVTADSYLVADIDTGDVLLEYNAATPRPIASVTKLMTALVANETIMFDREIEIAPSIVRRSGGGEERERVKLTVGDLLHPLLMESNNTVANRLAAYYSTDAFVGWMNTAAKALDMRSTRFADPSGISPENVSTTEDLFRLAVYLTNKKSFIWKISREAAGKELVAPGGEVFTFKNFNQFAHRTDFIGGKVGHTGEALDTMVSVFEIPEGETRRRVAVIVLRSDDNARDTLALTEWTSRAVALGANQAATACVACADPGEHRKIEVEF